MIRFIALIAVALIVYWLSDSAFKTTKPTTTAVTSKSRSAHKPTKEPSVMAKDEPVKPLEALFLEDDDFDITDLINADRSHK